MPKAATPDTGELPAGTQATDQGKTVGQMEDDAFALILAADQAQSGEPGGARPTTEPPPAAAAAPETDPVGDDSAAGASAGNSGDDGAAGTGEPEPTPDASAPGQASEDASKLPPEELSARKRIADAQNKMHMATKELAAERKARQSLETRLNELEKQLSAHRPAAQTLLDQFQSDLTPEEKRLITESEGMPGLIGKMLARMQQLETQVASKVDENLSARTKADEARAIEEKENAWRHAVMMGYPDYFDVTESPEYKSWAEAHAETVNAIVAKHVAIDPFSPAGAFEIRRLYEAHKAKSQPKPAAKHAAPTGSFAGKNARGEPARAPASKSREEMEADAWRELEAPGGRR